MNSNNKVIPITRNGKPRVSVVIPTRNNVPYLSMCLEALYMTLSKDSEIIVVSNGNDADMLITTGYVSGVAKVAPIKTVVIHCKNPGFSNACNAGMKLAQGEYIIILNDDTIPGPGWVEEMIRGLKAASDEAPEIKWGYAGPMSNNVMGRQLLDVEQYPYAGQPGGSEITSKQIQSEPNRPSFSSAGVVSGFCMLITRDLYKAIGDLDTFGMGGFEDNDYCLRAHQAGYLGIIAPKSFVFHFGHITLNKYVEDHRNGTKDQEPFMAKWYKPSKKHVTAAYRVHLKNDYDIKIFKKSLERVSQLVDSIAILDDRSPINVKNDIIDFLVDDVDIHIDPETQIKVIRNDDTLEPNEVRDRNAVIELARTFNPDWIWNLDHDEMPDDNLTKEQLQELCNPVDPHVKFYVLPIHTFWRGEKQIRTDSVWGQMTVHTLFKNEPAFGKIHGAGGSPFHCRRIPTQTPWDLGRANFSFVVKHYGYTTFEEAERKQKYYQEKDTDKNIGLIGTENYEHLTDERNLQLFPFRSPTVTLVYLSKNEQDDVLGRIRAYKNMFKNFMVVDTGSTDKTAAWCKEFDVEYYEYRCCEKACDPDHLICDFAAARNFAIEKCKTEYIFFMDPDEEFIPDTMRAFDKVMLEEADGYMTHIHNLNVDKFTGQQVTYKTTQPRLFRNHPEIRYQDKVHESLEKSFNGTDKQLINTGITIMHYGFLKTTPEQRKIKNDKYAEKLVEILNENPEDARALYAYAVHLNENRQFDDGDQLLGKAVTVNPKFWSARWEFALRLIKRGLDVLMATPADARPDPERWQPALNIIKSLLQYYPEIQANVRVINK